MPNPTQSDVHINSPLSNISVAYMQEQDNFIADKVFPTIPVEKQSDSYFIFDKGDFLRDEALPRGDSEESAGSGFRLSNTTYNCQVDAFHKDVGEQVMANADAVLNFDVSVTEYVTRKVLLRKDKKFASTFFQTGVWATDSSPATLWDAGTPSDPAVHVDLAKTTILNSTGYMPNTMVIPWAVLAVLRKSPFIKDQFKYTSNDSIDDKMIAKYLGLKNLIVAKSVQNTAKEGATSTGASILGKSALVCYVPENPGLMTPSAGYTFAWKGYTKSVDGVRVSRIPVPLKKAERFEVEYASDMKVIGADLGYFIPAPIS